MNLTFLAVAVLILIYTLHARGFGRMGITLPMLFLGSGVVAASYWADLDLQSQQMLQTLAEVTLALLLFSDATALSRHSARLSGRLALRMLAIGLPLAIGFGTLVNIWLLPDWPILECCVLAALLAPTDAALGKPVMEDPSVPERLRDTLNAESGLNDGLAFPFVVFFALLAVGEDSAGVTDRLVVFVLMQVGIGLAVGLLVGAKGRWLYGAAKRADRLDPSHEGVATLALIGTMYFLADALGGNSFVAVFAGGFAFANAGRDPVTGVRDFLEEDGQFLAILSFFFIGAYLAPLAVEHASLSVLFLVVLSLVVVRPLAIFLSLLGTRTTLNERLFLGWFGPRGLATALFAIFVLLDFDELPHGTGILVVTTSAVLVSAFVHGLTSRWGTRLFRLTPADQPGESSPD